jgi:hypothetical protein
MALAGGWDWANRGRGRFGGKRDRARGWVTGAYGSDWLGSIDGAEERPCPFWTSVASMNVQGSLARNGAPNSKFQGKAWADPLELNGTTFTFSSTIAFSSPIKQRCVQQRNSVVPRSTEHWQVSYSVCLHCAPSYPWTKPFIHVKRRHKEGKLELSSTSTSNITPFHCSTEPRNIEPQFSILTTPIDRNNDDLHPIHHAASDGLPEPRSVNPPPNRPGNSCRILRPA